MDPTNKDLLILSTIAACLVAGLWLSWMSGEKPLRTQRFWSGTTILAFMILSTVYGITKFDQVSWTVFFVWLGSFGAGLGLAFITALAGIELHKKLCWWLNSVPHAKKVGLALFLAGMCVLFVAIMLMRVSSITSFSMYLAALTLFILGGARLSSSLDSRSYRRQAPR